MNGEEENQCRQSLLNRISYLENQLKVVEQDRDETKQALGKVTVDLIKLEAEKEGKTFEELGAEISKDIKKVFYK